MAHPLRPLEDFVLVCEGPDDYQFLNGILSRFTSEIYISEAGGGDNVSVLAAVLSPSVYIKDRDFKLSYENARQMLTPGKRSTYWPRVDMEAYLLYEDWFMSALRVIQESEAGRVQNMPSDEQQVLRDILEVADYFVADHAGRQTLEELTRLSKPIQFYATVGNSSILKDAEASDRVVWESYLAQEAQRLCEAGKTLEEHPAFTADEVRNRFQLNLRQYATWANDIVTIREHFSGKRIFKRLVLNWQPRDKGKKRPWELLRDEVMKQAISYSYSISDVLSHDPRLGDIGLLASKVVEKTL